MSYCTFNRFEGMWLGSLTNLDLTEEKNRDPLDWILARNKLAEIFIKAEKLEVNLLSRQLVEILPTTHPNFADSSLMQVYPPATQKQLLTLREYQNTFLPLLPLIVFLSDHQDLLRAIVAQCNLKTTHAIEIKEDILIWSYLLALISNQQLNSPNLNIGIIVTQVLATAKVKTTLTEKLEIVSQGCEEGITWQQLTEKLLSKGNWGQIAIALAVYCFGSTPQNFRLSIQRAANLDIQLARLTIALTATLSGAYNGMTGIPWSWRAINNHDQIYQQAQSIGRELWKSWLGIYSINEQQLSYDQQLHAVALPNRIQPRKALKIISQKIYLS